MPKLQEVARNVVARVEQNALKAGVVAILAAQAFAAHAAIPASFDTAMSDVQDDATSLYGKVFPIVVTILGFGIILKLTKRFGNKV